MVAVAAAPTGTALLVGDYQLFTGRYVLFIYTIRTVCASLAHTATAGCRLLLRAHHLLHAHPPAGPQYFYGTTHTWDRVAPGEALSFFRVNHLTLPAAVSTTVASVSQVKGSSVEDLLSEAYQRASKEANATPCSACHAGLNDYHQVSSTTHHPPTTAASLVCLIATQNPPSR